MLNPYLFAPAPVAGLQYIVWQGKVNVTESAGSRLDCVGVSGWGAHAYSQQQADSGKIYTEHLATETNGNRILGLTNAGGALTDTYATLDFGVFLFGSSVYRIKEGAIGLVGTYASGDIIFIGATASGNIELGKNTTVLYTYTAPTINYPLKAMAFMEVTTHVKECKIQIG